MPSYPELGMRVLELPEYPPQIYFFNINFCPSVVEAEKYEEKFTEKMIFLENIGFIKFISSFI